MDLGGSHITAAVIDEAGTRLAIVRRPLPAALTPESVLTAIGDTIAAALAMGGSQVEGIGLGIPGLIDARTGTSLFSPNFGWRGVPVVEPIAQRFGLPVFMDNDVRCATVAEARFGAGRGAKNLICITVGTGIGSGIMVDGRMLLGASGATGEIGHMTVEPDGPRCRCGNRGCVEALAAAPAIVRRAREVMARAAAQGQATLLAQRTCGDSDAVDAALVARVAQAGDRLAREVITDAARFLGIAIANVANLINPSLVVLGGGVSLAGPLWFETVEQTVRTRAMPVQGADARIVLAQLGTDAGVVGAAALVFVAAE